MGESAKTQAKLVIFFNRNQDMDEEKEERYYQFATLKFFPWLQSHGLSIYEIWVTAYGEEPDQMIGLVANDYRYLYALLDSRGWRKITAELQQYVEDYQEVIVPYRPGFQIVRPTGG